MVGVTSVFEGRDEVRVVRFEYHVDRLYGSTVCVRSDYSLQVLFPFAELGVEHRAGERVSLRNVFPVERNDR